MILRLGLMLEATRVVMPDQIRIVLWRMRHVLEGRERTCTLVRTVDGWHLAISDDAGARCEQHLFPDEPSARIQAARTAISLSERGWTDATLVH